MTQIKKHLLDAVFFDLDGTLVDSAPDFILCINAIADNHGLQRPDPKIFTQHISGGATHMVYSAFGLDRSLPHSKHLVDEFLNIYGQLNGQAAKLFNKVEVLISKLETKKIPWGIITNKKIQYAEPLITTLKLTPRCLVCPDHVTEKKPNPEPMHLACSQLKVNAKNCIYIGDHKRDIQAGNAANMHTIAAAYGYIENNDSAGSWQADYYAATPEKISRIIDLHFV